LIIVVVPLDIHNTCPFWISVGLYLRGRSKSNKQSGVFLRENKTKVNYNKWDYLNNLEDSRVANSQVTKPCTCVERIQKGIAYWDKQDNDVPAPNCVLKV